MAEAFVSLPGNPVAPDQLRLPKARAIVHYLQRDGHPFARLFATLRQEETGQETVIVEVDVQRPQRVVHPIHYSERIAVRVSPADNAVPEVLVLRADFPPVPHLNLTVEEIPRSLCLYEAPYDELRLTWTAPAFVERIRTWLAETAIGTLHAPDQPLEPLLLPAIPHVILPYGVLDEEETAAAGEAYIARLLPIARIPVGNDRDVYTTVIEPGPPPPGNPGTGVEILALTMRGQPQTHGVIARQPTTLAELQQLLLPAGIDVLKQLRTLLLSRRTESRFLEIHLVIVVALPMRREDGSAPETTYAWAFFVPEPNRRLGEQIGIWSMQPGLLLATQEGDRTGVSVPVALATMDASRQGQDTQLQMWNPTFTLSRGTAAAMNGISLPAAVPAIAAIGMGALGSQVFADLMRAGYGIWVVIDADYVLPHNLARYAIFADVAGQPKAEVMAHLANRLIDGPAVARAIVADVLHPAEAQRAELDSAYAWADVILDLSASIPVARSLARDLAAPARRASYFVTPTGTDAVLLMEDQQRHLRLDALEMQYYRYLLQHTEWHDHLSGSEEHGRIRYGRSCRDLSSVIPHDRLALHAANGSRALRAALAADGAHVQLWHAEADGSIRTVQVAPVPMQELVVNGWTISSDDDFLAQIQARRRACLPNETGGILLGAYDMSRRVVYVVDSLPSPIDSLELPGGYVRGQAGMQSLLDEVERVTGGMIVYLGEWHSHPLGHTSSPSAIDGLAYEELRALRKADGLPMLMLIVGDEEVGPIMWLLDDPEQVE